MIRAENVHATLEKYQLADGYPIVLDLEKSKGCYLHDSRSGKDYLDFFTCFASWPIGFNHPGMSEPEFVKELTVAAQNNPANSDLYTVSMASFVEAFGEHVTPDEFPHHFWVAGGALAVENALKVAFDWKAHKVEAWTRSTTATSLVDACTSSQAFHGRSGYTMSLTNTVPDEGRAVPEVRLAARVTPGDRVRLDGGIANDIEAAEARDRAPRSSRPSSAAQRDVSPRS